MENEDDTNLLAQLQEALDACEQQHQREKGLLRQIDEQLKASDGYLRAELQAIVSRSRERRILEAAVSKTDKQRAARPKVKTATLTIRVSPAHKKGLAALAEHLGLSQSDLLMQLAGERARACGIDWKD